MGGTRDGVGRCLFMAAWRRGRGGKGQGVWLGATWGQEERRGWGRGAVALGCSDSSRWRTSHRRGGRAVNRGGGGSERRGHIGWRVGPGDSGARWTAARCRMARQRVHDADTWAWQHSAERPEFKLDSKIFKTESNFLNFDRSKRCLPLLQKLEIKYGWKELEVRNNFSYRNLSRFELKCEWKFKEFSMSWNRRKFTRKSWNFGFQRNLASKLLVTPYCKKNPFLAKEGQKVKFHSKWESGLSSR
jgi:hypothetical protein